MYSVITIFRQKLRPVIYNFDVMFNDFKNHASMLIGYTIYNISNDNFYIYVTNVPGKIDIDDIKAVIAPRIKKTAKEMASIDI